MKALLFVISIFYLQGAFAQCAGAPGANHTNPDSTIGGFIATTAYVAPEAYISSNSQVTRPTVLNK